MKAKKTLLVAAVALVSLTTAQSAFARNYDVQNGYWTNAHLVLWDVSNYNNSVSSAVAGWNNLRTNAQITYYRSQPAYEQIEVASKPHDTNWAGATTITMADGTVCDPEASIPPAAYSFAWCELNETIINGRNYSANLRIAVAGHEIGHALAAGHDHYSNSIMYTPVNEITATYAGDDEKSQMWMKYGVTY